MIKGRTHSADGGFRRIPVRHIKIVDNETRVILVNYLNDMVYQKCLVSDWVGYKDLFPNLPEDIIDTPLKIIYDICQKRFEDNPKSIFINLSKYLGMLVREAVYYSDTVYYERMIKSVREYSLESKNLKEDSFEQRRNEIIARQNNGSK